MLDRIFIPVANKAFQPLGQRLAGTVLKPELLIGLSLALGIVAAFAVIIGGYYLALALFLFSRVFDGIAEGAGQAGGITAFGRYLDIFASFTVYGAITLGFAVAEPENALIATLLAVSLLIAGGASLGYAGVARGLKIKRDHSGKPLLDFMAGLVGTTELFIAYVLMFLLPGFFPAVATLLALALLGTTFFRILKAKLQFLE